MKNYFCHEGSKTRRVFLFFSLSVDQPPLKLWQAGISESERQCPFGKYRHFTGQAKSTKKVFIEELPTLKILNFSF